MIHLFIQHNLLNYNISVLFFIYPHLHKEKQHFMKQIHYYFYRRIKNFSIFLQFVWVLMEIPLIQNQFKSGIKLFTIIFKTKSDADIFIDNNGYNLCHVCGRYAIRNDNFIENRAYMHLVKHFRRPRNLKKKKFILKIYFDYDN